MNNDAFLITRPNHDITTIYLHCWAKVVIGEAEKRNFKVYDLKDKKANRARFEGTMRKTEPGLVFINGHGNNDCVTGYDNEVLIKAGDNEELLSGKIVYALSCKSAKKLGVKSVKSGAKAYLGYNDDFVFVIDEDMSSRPQNDKKAALFLDPSNLLIISLLKGHSPELSYEKSQRTQNKTIRRLLSSEADSDSKNLLLYLLWNRNNQVCIQ